MPKKYNETQQAISDAYDQVYYAQQVLACRPCADSDEISSRLLAVSNELIDLIVLAKDKP